MTKAQMLALIGHHEAQLRQVKDGYTWYWAPKLSGGSWLAVKQTGADTFSVQQMPKSACGCG